MRSKYWMMLGAALLLLAGAIKQPAMTAYAAETGPGVAVSQQATAIVTYNQATAKALGAWEPQTDGNWKFKQVTGEYLTSAWIEDASTVGTWYFVDGNGIMLKSATTPDGYTVDAEGRWFETQSSGSHAPGGNSGQSVDSSATEQTQTSTGAAAGEQTSGSELLRQVREEGKVLTMEEIKSLTKEEKDEYVAIMSGGGSVAHPDEVDTYDINWG